MGYYRKRPIVIEARLFDTLFISEQEALANWCNGKLRGYRLDAADRVIQIQTLEGRNGSQAR